MSNRKKGQPYNNSLLLVLSILILFNSGCMAKRNINTAIDKKEVEIQEKVDNSEKAFDSDTATINLETPILESAISSTGKYLAIVSGSEIIIYTISGMDLEIFASAKINGAVHVRWRPDETQIAIGSNDKNIYFYDVQKEMIVYKTQVSDNGSPYFEWSNDGNWIMAIVNQPTLDSSNVAARLYRVEDGLELVKELFFSTEDAMKWRPVSFDWNKDSPEKMQLLIRVSHDVAYYDKVINEFRYFDFPNLTEFGYLGIYWLENDEFLIINDVSDPTRSIYFVKENEIVNDFLSDQVETSAISAGWYGVISDDKTSFASFENDSINIYRINDKELEYIGGVKVNDLSWEHRLMINWRTKQAYVYKWSDTKFIVYDISNFLD